MSWAGSIAADIAGSLAEMEGECVGNPALLAGESITLGMAGQPFDGYYICSAARHVFAPNSGGYTTWVTVGGFRDRSLFALSSGASSTQPTRPSISGLVIGTVVDNVDPMELGQVKVMFPWLAPDYISAWCRVMQIGASKAGGGFLWVPEIDDEVLIGFDRGSIDHPFVIGNLYNGVASPLPPPEIAGVVRQPAHRLPHGPHHPVERRPGGDGDQHHDRAGREPPDVGGARRRRDQDHHQLAGAGGDHRRPGGVDLGGGGPLSLNAPTISIGSEETASVSVAGASVSVGGPTTESVAVGSPSTAEVSVSGAIVSLGAG